MCSIFIKVYMSLLLIRVINKNIYYIILYITRYIIHILHIYFNYYYNRNVFPYIYIYIYNSVLFFFYKYISWINIYKLYIC